MELTLNKLGKWAEHMPAVKQLCELTGVDPHEPMRNFIDYGITGVGYDEAVEQLPADGLILLEYESACEVRRDGVTLWTDESVRFYNEVYVLVDGRVQHMAMDNQGTELHPFNKAVDPPCQICDMPDGHGTVVTSWAQHFRWCMN